MHEDLLATPVAELVRREFVAVRTGQTLADAMATVRLKQPAHRVVYFYAVNEEGQLVGVLPTRKLLLADPESLVESLMLDRFIAVPGTLPLLEACEFFILHRLLALPVVDSGGKMLGVIDVDQFAEGLTELGPGSAEDDQEPVTPDAIFQLIGLRLAEVRGESVIGRVRGRFLWLLCNVAGGLLAAGVMSLFQATLDRAVTLALFVPVVLALAESVSIQSLTIALRDRPDIALGKLLRAETPVGLMLGFACGLLLSGVAAVFTRDLRLALVLLLSMLFAITYAALLGRLVPAFIGRRGRDPKVASGPLVLTLTDLCTLAGYLTLATLLL